MVRISIYCILLTAAFAGCDRPAATVQGTVTIDGQLVSRGTVVFHPVSSGPTAYGTIDKHGSYALRVGQGDLNDPNAGDISTGEYIVTVVVNTPPQRDETVDDGSPPMPGARVTPPKYASKDTTDLRATVKPGRNVVPLELEAAVAEEAVEAPETTEGEPTDANEAGGEVDDTAAFESKPGDRPLSDQDSVAVPSDVPIEDAESVEPVQEQNP
jgi:hypothetical protein